MTRETVLICHPWPSRQNIHQSSPLTCQRLADLLPLALPPLFTSHKVSHFHLFDQWQNLIPPNQPPLTCANDLASTAGLLAIVVSNLLSELHMLRWSYNLLSREFTRTQNLLEAVMAAHHLGSTDEAWHVERQLKQDLNECVNSNFDLLQRLDNQNLVIASS